MYENKISSVLLYNNNNNNNNNYYYYYLFIKIMSGKSIRKPNFYSSKSDLGHYFSIG